jgi:hypothetical protein
VRVRVMQLVAGPLLFGGCLTSVSNSIEASVITSSRRMTIIPTAAAATT